MISCLYKHKENLDSPKKPGICFVCPYIYPLFNSQYHTMFGGWEVRIALIAKELAERANYRVSIIVADHGQPHIEYREGVELISWQGKVFWGVPAKNNQVLSQDVSSSTSPTTQAIYSSSTNYTTEAPVDMPSTVGVVEFSSTTNAMTVALPGNQVADHTVVNSNSRPSATKTFSWLKNTGKRIYRGIVPLQARDALWSLRTNLKNWLISLQRNVSKSIRIGLTSILIWLKIIAKRIYKSLVPWRVRIVVTGLLAGLKKGLAHLLHSWGGAFRIWTGSFRVWIMAFKTWIGSFRIWMTAFRTWIGSFRIWVEAIKMAGRGARDSLFVFIDYVRPSLATARRAFGHIADDAVFQEMVSIYEEANADIYVVPGNSHISTEVACYCKNRHRAFIMLAGSDIDFDPEIRAKPNDTDMYGLRYTLKLYTIKSANRHIVQNEHQAEMAKAFGCSPVLIRNPIDLDCKFSRATNPDTILWVGNTVERIKQPYLMLRVIGQLPDYPFVMIVTPESQIDLDRLSQNSQSIPNLSLLSRIPFEEVEQYYAQAKIFVNTSTFEGFPNTFLQAGKYGVPIISLKVDPNGMISRHGCGLLCHDNVTLLRENIQKVMSEPVLYTRLSSQIMQYVRQYHDKDKIVPQYEKVFHSVLKRKRFTYPTSRVM